MENTHRHKVTGPITNSTFHYLIFLLIVAVPFGGFSQSQVASKASPVVADGATLVKAGTDYLFTEGPAVDSQGNVFFTDQPNDRILKWSPGGTISVFMQGAGRSNGLFVDKAGNLLSCADMNNELWLIDKNKKVTVLVKDFEGKKLNGPNDLWIDSKGGVYFTDPFYKRDYWTRTQKEIEKENVYYLSPDHKKLSIAATDFVRPNGIVGSGDGKRLFVADINDSKTYAFTIAADGSLTDRKVFAPMGSDGMTIDSHDNLYLTGKGITVFDRDGKQIDQIPVDEPWTANVCFGGKDLTTLFITASKSVYTLKMKVKGVR
ncbi:MAG TPA: SMP-30/gluconolactonase/LRE family protein [Chryseolinea sp.]|nr:SMP-30/gluconolactonase/LRE family protein [Chryseolinea sp.]